MEDEKKKKFNKQDYDNAYIRDNKDRINFLMPKGYKARIKTAADAAGISAAEWIRQAIDSKFREEKLQQRN